MDPSHEPRVAAFLRERVRPGVVCFDVGANVGVYALQFAHWSAPDGQVVAFEPNPAAFDGLASHIRLNHLVDRIRAVKVGIGSDEGWATLWAAGPQGESRIGSPEPTLAAGSRALSVPLTTIDRFCDSTGIEPDWLLIDIEGFELAALRGAERTILRRKSALGIVTEMHPYAWASLGENNPRKHGNPDWELDTAGFELTNGRGGRSFSAVA